jgi:hypothetical protein
MVKLNTMSIRGTIRPSMTAGLRTARPTPMIAVCGGFNNGVKASMPKGGAQTVPA